MVNLKEYIHPEMDVLFLALNAPEVSNANAHWFSRNLSFWNLLYRSGLINQKITDTKKGDETVFGSNEINFEGKVFGVTDLNNEIVQTDSRGVNVEQRHVNRILEILMKNKVEKLCLMHSTVGIAFRESQYLQKTTGNRYGLIGSIGQTEVYEVPFHNASVADKERHYSILTHTSFTVKTPSESHESPPVIQTVKTTSQTHSKPTGSGFTIPKDGNSITKKDIDKGVLRITADFKDFFPMRDTSVKIKVGSIIKNTAYQINEGRSSLLKIGRDMMNALNLKPGERLHFEKMPDGGGYEIMKHK